MTSIECSGADELDFRLVFGEDALQQPTGPAESDIRNPVSSTQVPFTQPIGQEQRICLPFVPNPTPLQTSGSYQSPACQTQGSQYSFLRNPTAFGCPSIQITSIAPNNHVEVGSVQDAGEPIGAEGGFPEQTWSRDHLFLSLDPCYRDAALSPSPCSSLSSRSWLSDVSSCESFSHIYDDEEGDLNEAAARFTLGSPLTSPLASPGCGGGAFGVELWQQKYQDPQALNQALSSHQSPRQSPCPSPRYSPRTSVTEETWLNPWPTSRSPSRPTSPGGKRRHSSADVQAHSPSPHHSPTPTPGHSPRGSVTEDTWLGSHAGALGPLLYCYQDLDVPSKTRRTTGTQLCLLTGQKDSGIEEVKTILPVLDSPGEACGKPEDLADLFLPVPSHFSWNKPKPPSTPLFRSSSLPPLDWALPSQYGQCELIVEVQPKSHHRAHYETEGSRGSIKAVSGGHPVVKLNGYKEQPVNLQVYIGTADDRYLRPHPFYQVHRVTGKTVSTACQERFVCGAKILEIPLLPEHNMSASIDCAGILKLRNADIELRKGETDIGRKNTRVRVVFRVNIPQPNDKMLCLQTASVPVECSQRSAVELPQVEHVNPTSSSMDGGEEMVISGSNVSCHSKVFFLEKGPDGRTRWEVDVKVVPEKSSGSRITIKIPPYHNRNATGRVQVQFYVSNGKRKRSQTLSFTYLDPSADLMAGAPLVKQEPSDLDYIPCNPLSSPDQAFCLDIPFHESCGQVPYDRTLQPAYSQLVSFPLQGHRAHAGQPQINTMNMVDLMPASQTAPQAER
ncbi:nuclear factor of activated T-cells, cytoplasmic 3 isoform X2 [Lampris incognitus]|uniref:nuclear factor of activated T-cells, cytoplasmic 3 isoform X2 n=1 Tax=Lampris incognitus TaxID=2546036 RepID=UPI0024B540BD|nr:nuclear factor of activated T-cells, cytoplasmic 3 isoform X2 [Lampris incognitus]